MDSLTSQLDYFVGKTVVNKTGLTGEYDFVLEFRPEGQLAPAGTAANNGTDARPDILTALGEQLGLKLVPARAPVRSLVIDSADLPTAN